MSKQLLALRFGSAAAICPPLNFIGLKVFFLNHISFFGSCLATPSIDHEQLLKNIGIVVTWPRFNEGAFAFLFPLHAFYKCIMNRSMISRLMQISNDGNSKQKQQIDIL